MESWKAKILLDLNSISRVAVIEQAYGVEKMLINYTKLLKYRWSYEGKAITANMELAHVEMLLEYYQVKWNKCLTFQIHKENSVTSDIDISSLIIPHFTLCGTLINCLEEIQAIGMPLVEIKVLTSIVDDKPIVTIIFQGNMYFEQVRENILSKQSTEYDTFYIAQRQWINKYGNDSVTVKVERESLMIKFTINEVVSINKIRIGES